MCIRDSFDYVAPQDAIDKFDSEDANFLTDNFLPNVLDLAVNSNGEQVGIPYSLSSPVLYINKDLLKEAGLSEDGPETWQEVQEFAETVKEKKMCIRDRLWYRQGKCRYVQSDSGGSVPYQCDCEHRYRRFPASGDQHWRYRCIDGCGAA